jgi:hypothetical protein
MARHREIPKCPWCGEIIAKAVHTRPRGGSTFVGDTFSHWEFINHDCPNKPVPTAEDIELGKSFMEDLERKMLKGTPSQEKKELEEFRKDYFKDKPMEEATKWWAVAYPDDGKIIAVFEEKKWAQQWAWNNSRTSNIIPTKNPNDEPSVASKAAQSSQRLSTKKEKHKGRSKHYV